MGRKKRSVSGSGSTESNIIEEEATHFFDMAMELDKSKLCLPKVFCEISAVPRDKRGNFTEFQRDVVEVTKFTVAGIRQPYTPQTPGEFVVFGALVGDMTKNRNVCHQLFTHCEDSDELVKALNFIYPFLVRNSNIKQ